MAKPKRSARSKLKGEGLAAFEELQARLVPDVPVTQARWLDAGIDAFATRIPDVVIELLAEAEPISVAEATARAAPTGKTWQDTKATLELKVRLVRARAQWERDDQKSAALELVQISASASSRRNELILQAAEMRPAWSPTFSLALLRSASGAMANSLPAALSMIDALTGSGEQPAAAMILGQVISAWPLWPELDRAALTDRIERLAPEHRPPLEAQLAAAAPPAG